jgi:hypothetical protein
MQSVQGDRVSSLVMLSEFRSGNIHLSRSLSVDEKGEYCSASSTDSTLCELPSEAGGP